MQTERTTKEIETPGGHKVVINDYMTGGELRKVQAVYMEGLTAHDVMGKNGIDMAHFMSKVPVNTVYKAQEVALELILVSVDGITENPFKHAMDLPEADLNMLFTEIDAYTSGTLAKKKE